MNNQTSFRHLRRFLSLLSWRTLQPELAGDCIFAGTSIAAALFVAAVVTQMWWLIAVALVQGYAFAWIGHFFFEHNKPAHV